MAGEIQPIGTFQYNPYSMYGGMYGYGLDDLDMDYGLGMNSSIFGMNPYMYGGIGTDNQSYFDNMRNYQQFYNEYNIEQQKMQRNADLQLNGAIEAIKSSAGNLKDKIERNEQDQIKVAYQAYLDAVRNAYGEGTEKEIRSRAAALYEQINGVSLIKDLRANSNSSFVQGLIQTLTLGFYDNKSAEDNISEITGQPVSMDEKTEQNLGRITGAAVIGGGAYAGVKLLSGHTSGILKSAGKILGTKAGIIALAAAAIAGTLAILKGKVST